MNIKKNDIVKVISGKDKGKKAKVIKVFSGDGKILVEGVNLMAKNVRPKRQGEKGQVVRYSAPFSAAKVQLFCSKCNRAVKVGYTFTKEGKKVRICRRCGQSL